MAHRRELLHAHVLLEHLRPEDIDDELACDLVSTAGIWLAPRLFQRLPILLPHVVRDTTARARTSPDGEQWGAPNAHGYLRDDNSLIKEAVKALPVESPRLGDRSYRIGSGWVASHVWQFTVDGVRATLDATTNSFIPNMVWLPRSLARLSDVQGSPLQAHLIAIARQLYGAVELRARLKQIVEATWARLPGPWGPVRRPLGPLNFFEVDDGWVERRTQTIRNVHAALTRDKTTGERAHLRPTRYRTGLTTSDRQLTEPLRRWLADYVGALDEQAGA